MSPEQFAYWMQGFVELTDVQPPTAEQWKSICEHLKTVFVKVTSPVGPAPMPSVKDMPWPTPAPTLPPWKSDTIIC
jgi:hypothetical protein